MHSQPSKLGELSPIPSRATHSSPHLSSLEIVSAISDAHSKHSKQSLSQTTIPEEGPEHSDKQETQLPIFEAPIAAVCQIPERRKEQTTSLTLEDTGAKRKDISLLKKAMLSREDPGFQPPAEPVKTRQESLFFKAIRGTNRGESKSKTKDAEATGQTGDIHLPSATSTTNTPKFVKKDSSKKNVQEKRDLFKKSH